MIRNVHSRIIKAGRAEAGKLLNTISSRDDRLWPYDHWPRMEFEGDLKAGTAGGHGPIHYCIKRYEPGKSIQFTFLHEEKGLSKGLEGEHRFEIIPKSDGCIELRHTISARAHGMARILWPLIIRPLHDALLEDCLDKAEFELSGGLPDKPARWSLWVRLLRGVIGARKRS